MIGRLQGRIILKSPPILLIDVQGVGYEVEAPMTTFYQLPEVGAEVQLFTHLSVRDDAHLLFGFASEHERHLFRTLIRVNGVGAKMALTILSGMEADDFARCIREGDTLRLTRLPGVGKKTAERLLVEMRDRLKDFLPQAADAADKEPASAGGVIEEAISALIGLGYKPQEASRFVHAVADDVSAEGAGGSEELIRAALRASVSKG